MDGAVFFVEAASGTFLVWCGVFCGVCFPEKIEFQFCEIKKGGQISLPLLEKAIRQSTRIPPFGLSQSRSVSLAYFDATHRRVSYG